MNPVHHNVVAMRNAIYQIREARMEVRSFLPTEQLDDIEYTFKELTDMLSGILVEMEYQESKRLNELTMREMLRKPHKEDIRGQRTSDDRSEQGGHGAP